MTGRVPLFHCITDGIRITVRPSWLRSQSTPSKYVFTYRVRIENCGSEDVQLLTRRWHIHDDGAGDTVVGGDGVVGQQPHIAPGQVHEYESYCVLTSPNGWMEGSYGFVRRNTTTFDARIPRFDLAAEPTGTDDALGFGDA